jgi:hypothetical protein
MREALDILSSDRKRMLMRERFMEVRRSLGEGGVVERLRNLFSELLG